MSQALFIRASKGESRVRRGGTLLHNFQILRLLLGIVMNSKTERRVYDPPLPISSLTLTRHQRGSFPKMDSPPKQYTHENDFLWIYPDITGHITIQNTSLLLQCVHVVLKEMDGALTLLRQLCTKTFYNS